MAERRVALQPDRRADQPDQDRARASDAACPRPWTAVTTCATCVTTLSAQPWGQRLWTTWGQPVDGRWTTRDGRASSTGRPLWTTGSASTASSTAPPRRADLRRRGYPQGPQPLTTTTSYLSPENSTPSCCGTARCGQPASEPRSAHRPTHRQRAPTAHDTIASTRRRHRMKFRVERDALADAVAWTARSLPTRPPVPVLAGVLLRVADGRLTVSGFDYEVSSQVDGRGAGRRATARRWSPAGCSPRSPRRCRPSRSTSPRRHRTSSWSAAAPGSPCRRMPVEDYPTLPDDAGQRRHGRRRRRSPPRSPRSPSPPAGTTRCRC